MDKDTLIARYNELYDLMSKSKNPKYMRIFGEAEKYILGELAGSHIDIAERWLTHLEPVCWNNYLSEKESENIARHIVNQDGTSGFHWPYLTFVSMVEKFGDKIEDKPYYNTRALWVVANMIYSDHARSIAEDMGYKNPQEIPADRIAISCYKKAVEKLKDVDNDDFVRDYFRRKMYDN